MIRQVYRLTAVRQIEAHQVQTDISDCVLVRPRYMAICAADQRYYSGRRDPDALKGKLPMALIHEAAGTVCYDPSGTLPTGAAVVCLPNIPGMSDDGSIAENYHLASRFRSSGADGFMQSLVPMDAGRLIAVREADMRIMALCELLSVAVGAVKGFISRTRPETRRTIGVWGDGSVGFAVCVALRYYCPEVRLVVIGRNPVKLSYFPFAKQRMEPLPVDHAFECVGGRSAEQAIDEIIGHISPCGTVSLLGVSEYAVPVNTRLVLERGLSLTGYSRSAYGDFQDAVHMLERVPEVRGFMSAIISDECAVHSIADIHDAFVRDMSNDFKTVIKWDI